jgi:DNA-binding beta-propeller fold protein YncE
MNRILTIGFAAMAVLAPASTAGAAPAPVTLEPLGRTPAQGEGGAEIAAYAPAAKRIFATNAAANRLDVYDAANPSAPSLTRSIDLAPYGGGPNSVDVAPGKHGVVAVAVEAAAKTDPGSVELFDVSGAHLASVPAGPLPDMLTFTDDGKTLLVANEGEPDGVVDPAGSVTVIDLRRGVTRARTRTARLDGVPRLGPVRDVGLEPEYITTAFGGRLAYVSLQEANAIAVLDVDDARFRLIRGLGYKDHGAPGNGLDPSDRDGGIAINPWQNVLGMYQPDAIAAYQTGPLTWIATANEGDALADGSEEVRAKDLVLDPTAFPDGEAADAKLGRLTVTNRQGDSDGDGDYDRLYAFGGRSMSVLDPLGGIVSDTGDELERLTAQLDAGNFNKDNVPSAIDNRSDNKGPEPEGLDIGRAHGRTYAFLAAERSGGIFAYDLSHRPGRASFAGYVNTREADLGPEGVRFVTADDSPTGEPLVLVTNEISGTVAILAVRPT